MRKNVLYFNTTKKIPAFLEVKKLKKATIQNFLFKEKNIFTKEVVFKNDFLYKKTPRNTEIKLGWLRNE